MNLPICQSLAYGLWLYTHYFICIFAYLHIGIFAHWHICTLTYLHIMQEWATNGKSMQKKLTSLLEAYEAAGKK